MAVARVREFLLWALWVILAAIWAATLLSSVQHGDLKQPAWAILDLALLCVLFFAEGLELAAADLLDKDVDQMKDGRSRSILSEIKRRPDWFFAHRQVFVVAIIAIMSLTTSYEAVTVPFVGSVAEYGVPFAFSLIFTTLTVLWFCQVTPKRLAIANSEQFLRASAWVWRLITVVSRAGLPDPANSLVAFAKSHSRYRHPRVLPPSRGQFYNLTARFFCNALDRVSVTVCLANDGTLEVRRRVLHLFVGGRHETVVGYFDSASAFVGDVAVRVCGLYALQSPPERLDDLAPALDRLFAGDGEARQNIAASWQHRVETFASSSPDLLRRIYWMIAGAASLPGDLSPDGGCVALVYEATVRMAPGGLSFPGENGLLEGSWSEAITYACRRFDVKVKADHHDQTSPHIGDYVVTHGEQRQTVAADTRRGAPGFQYDELSVPFPLLSATYDIPWSRPEMTAPPRGVPLAAEAVS